MAKREKPQPDANEIATGIVAAVEVSGERPKNPAAVALGKLGGLKGGRARADSLSKRRRSEIAKKAAEKRWEGHKKGS